jgi:hypothetical protein
MGGFVLLMDIGMAIEVPVVALHNGLLTRCQVLAVALP